MHHSGRLPASTTFARPRSCLGGYGTEWASQAQAPTVLSGYPKLALKPAPFCRANCVQARNAALSFGPAKHSRAVRVQAEHLLWACVKIRPRRRRCRAKPAALAVQPFEPHTGAKLKSSHLTQHPPRCARHTQWEPGSTPLRDAGPNHSSAGAEASVEALSLCAVPSPCTLL